MKKTAKKKEPKGRYSVAYRKAVEEIDKDHVLEIKAMVKGTLEAISAKLAARAKLDEELSFLKADIEDLKRGRAEKIKARHADDTKMAEQSKIDPEKILRIANTPALTSGYVHVGSNTTQALPTWVTTTTAGALADYMNTAGGTQ